MVLERRLLDPGLEVIPADRQPAYAPEFPMPPCRSSPAEPAPHATARTATSRLCGLARGLACALAIALPGLAGTQDPTAFAEHARSLLADPSPRVRGEASLVLAAARTASDLEAIRRVAGEPDAESAHRALVALGILAAPGTSQLLVPLLPEPGARVDDRAVVASFALALLPDEQGSAELARVLVRTRQGSFRRQQSLLHALALGSSLRSGSQHAGALEQLLRDTALKDPSVRSLLLLSLARVDGMPADTDLTAALASASPEERVAALRILLQRAAPVAQLDAVLRLQERDPDPAVRAGALAVLTRLRHAQALERAVRSLRATEATERVQAVRTLLLLGGGALRGAVESAIRAETDPDQATAMLLAWRGAPSEAMAAWCREAALDARKPAGLRTACALVALDQAGDELGAVLTTGLLDCTDPAPREAAAMALRRRGGNLALDALAPADALHAERSGRVVGALLRAGHPQATPHALRLLANPQAGPALRAAVLTAVRTALLPWLDAGSGPGPLRSALAP